MYLLEGLRQKRKEIKASFHVPGHKFGRYLNEVLGEDPYQLDFTEIPGTDNLHHAEGIIRKSEERLADLYGSEEAHFLVNGSTAGNLAMILAAVKPGQKLLIARDCHKSVYNAILLSHAVPILIDPTMSPDGLVAVALTAESVEKGLLDHPDAVGLVMTYPNYYGHCSDIKKIVAIVHKYDRILLVDGAHSAHFVLSDGFPICAVEAGADGVVQSTHKTLLSLTQSSVIHIQGNRLDRDRLAYYLSALQTSSPSYILMSSLDATMAILEQRGAALGRELLGYCEDFLGWLEAAGLQTYEKNMQLDPFIIKDISRMNLSPAGMMGSGYDLDHVLRTEFGIQCELSTHNAVVCIATIGNIKEDFEQLVRALKKLKNQGVFEPVFVDNLFRAMPAGCTPAEAMLEKRSWVTLEKACEGVLADFITPYPPGIPMMLPGTTLTASDAKIIAAFCHKGHEMTGVRRSGDHFMVQIIERKS